jgi:hypothetical protein
VRSIDVAKVVDQFDALADEDLIESQDGNELAGTGLQHEAGH